MTLETASFLTTFACSPYGSSRNTPGIRHEATEAALSTGAIGGLLTAVIRLGDPSRLEP